MAAFFESIGDLTAAAKSYRSTKHYCSTKAQGFEMCLNILRVSLLDPRAATSTLMSYVGMAESNLATDGYALYSTMYVPL